MSVDWDIHSYTHTYILRTIYANLWLRCFSESQIFSDWELLNFPKQSLPVSSLPLYRTVAHLPVWLVLSGNKLNSSPVLGQVWTLILVLRYLWGSSASCDKRRFKGSVWAGEVLVKKHSLKKKSWQLNHCWRKVGILSSIIKVWKYLREQFIGMAENN